MVVERVHTPPRRAPSLRRALLRPQLFVWAVYVFLIPLYIFKSGLPQPGDVFILLLVPVALAGWNGRLPPNALPPVRRLIWFTLWVAIVDYAWALITGKFALFGQDMFVLFPVYYVYNALVFLVVLVLYRRYGDNLIRVTFAAVMVTVGLQIAASLVVSSGDFRGSLFFSNPNQLGYYALICACLVALLHARVGLTSLASSLLLLACAYLALLSASRAALAGVLMLFALMFLSNVRVLVIAVVLGGAVIAIGGPVIDAFESTSQRIERARNSHASFFEERGYDRIWKHPEHVVLGAGEGGLSRWAADSKIISRKGERKAIEIHSSIGMLLFSYGIPGVLLFAAFAWSVVRGAPLRMALILVPPALYTVAHQGLRFTLLWVLLALFVVTKQPAVTAARTP